MPHLGHQRGWVDFTLVESGLEKITSIWAVVGLKMRGPEMGIWRGQLVLRAWVLG